MLEAWVGLILARRAPFKKSTFMMGEREREKSQLGLAMGAQRGAKEAQGQAQASPRILAPKVEASGVCVYEKFPLRKLSMKA